MQYRSQLDVDYKQTSPFKTRKQHHYALSVAVTLIILTVMGAVIANVGTPQSDTKITDQVSASLVDTIELPLNSKNYSSDIKYSATQTSENIASSTESTNQSIPNPTQSISTVDTVVIKRGDSLSSLFSKRGLNTELHKIMQLGDKVKELKSVYPNQKLHFHLENDNLIGIELETSVNRRLKVVKREHEYLIDEVVRDFEIRTQVASSTIENSLFLAGQSAGLSDALIMELANVFGWDIDFALDIRVGDQFSIVYEEKYLDGEKIKDGDIIAAEFINSGERYRAVRYTDSNGNTDYYSQDGRSMRKPFLRTPVDFARISSRFNLKRKHPVLNKIRAHKGVDYAASTGTPIKSSGAGKIVHRGKKGGYGRTILSSMAQNTAPYMLTCISMRETLKLASV